jgi:hypothetical protein
MRAQMSLSLSSLSHKPACMLCCRYMRATDPSSSDQIRDEGLCLYALQRMPESGQLLAEYLRVSGHTRGRGGERGREGERKDKALRWAGARSLPGCQSEPSSVFLLSCVSPPSSTLFCPPAFLLQMCPKADDAQRVRELLLNIKLLAEVKRKAWGLDEDAKQ